MSAFGGVEVRRSGERYRPQVRQVRLACATSGASLMCVCTTGRWARGPALFHACALIDWRHGRVFAGARSRREGRPRSGSGAHVRRVHLTPRRPLPLIPPPPPFTPAHLENVAVERRTASRSPSSVRCGSKRQSLGVGAGVGRGGGNDRETGLFWLFGGAVGWCPVSP